MSIIPPDLNVVIYSCNGLPKHFFEDNDTRQMTKFNRRWYSNKMDRYSMVYEHQIEMATIYAEIDYERRHKDDRKEKES